MDLIIPDSWLREFLDTKATPQKIAECLSLCGPSVEKIERVGKDSVYHIEITTNRVDSANVYGIAREAAAILPRFKVKAALKPIKSTLNQKAPSDNLPLLIKCGIPEVRRVMAVVIDNVQNSSSPDWLKRRLELSGLRSLNILIDITNYLMLELGHPTHVFDYDRIKSKKLVFRKSDKGEKIKTLENKVYSLSGNDIVIDNGEGEIIDLPGIIGTANSVVAPDTKKIIFFIDNNDPVHMRKTSMNLGIRTAAVTINEKDVDPELASIVFYRGLELYKGLTKGKVASQIIDIYPKPYTGKTVKTNLKFINERLGVNVSKKEITDILEPLGFDARWTDENLEVGVPSWRAHDMNIPEDVVEEVARLYGYHNLPSKLMDGVLPDPLPQASFEFENKVKQILKGFGGTEVYTLSLVSEEKTYLGPAPLRLKNPLGNDSAYLRTTLMPSLVWAAEQNAHTREPFHLLEVANVYIPQKGSLPEERMTLGGIFRNYDYREAKGIIESLFSELHCNIELSPSVIASEAKQSLNFTNNGKIIGRLKILEDNIIYYEFDIELLRGTSSPFTSYTPIPKYPPQIEDLSLQMGPSSLLGQVIENIKGVDSRITSVELVDIYDTSRTLRISYQDPNKTLTDQEVAKIRTKILSTLQKKFGIRLKI